MGHLDEVLWRLSCMGPSDLEQVRVKLNMLKSISNPNHITKEHTDTQIMLDVITDVLRGFGVEYVSPFVLQKSPFYPAFKDKVTGVMQFFEQVSEDRITQRALMRLSIRLLYENLLTMNVPISSRTVMRHIHRIPAVINNSFPGYARMGMLSWIVRRETNGSDPSSQ